MIQLISSHKIKRVIYLTGNEIKTKNEQKGLKREI